VQRVLAVCNQPCCLDVFAALCIAGVAEALQPLSKATLQMTSSGRLRVVGDQLFKETGAVAPSPQVRSSDVSLPKVLLVVVCPQKGWKGCTG